MTTPRHSWGEPVRFPYKTERTCKHEGCSVVKVTRHEGDRHWQEFWRGMERLEGEATPPCVAKEQGARAA